MEKCDNDIRVENKKKKVMLALLVERGYDPDPVLRWKESQMSEQDKEADAGMQDDEDSPGESQNSQERSEAAQAKDYDYLLC